MKVLLCWFAAVIFAAIAGFSCPTPYLGWVALAVGFGWAAYDLIDDGDE